MKFKFLNHLRKKQLILLPDNCDRIQRTRQNSHSADYSHTMIYFYSMGKRNKFLYKTCVIFYLFFLSKTPNLFFILRKIFLKFVVHNLYFYKLFSHYKTTTN